MSKKNHTTVIHSAPSKPSLSLELIFPPSWMNSIYILGFHMAILLEQSVLSLSPNSTGLRKGSSLVLPRKKGTKYPLKCMTFQIPPAWRATY